MCHTRLSSSSCVGVFFVVASLVLMEDEAAAQIESRRIVVGIVVSAIRFVDFDPLDERDRQQLTGPHTDRPTWVDPGWGIRFSYRFKNLVGLEAEVSDYPRFVPGAPSEEFQFRGHAKQQFAGGLTLGRRIRNIGVFAKVRPGAIRFGALPTIFGESSNEQATLIGMAEHGPVFRPMVDLGGVAEVYVSRRGVVRLDVGDTIVWYRPRPSHLNPEFSRHNLQVTMGMGLRF